LCCRNALYDLPYGARDGGVFAACPPELLHQYGLGVEAKAFKYTWKVVEKATKERKAKWGPTKLAFDRRYAR
jgi:hypothetical protein